MELFKPRRYRGRRRKGWTTWHLMVLVGTVLVLLAAISALVVALNERPASQMPLKNIEIVWHDRTPTPFGA